MKELPSPSIPESTLLDMLFSEWMVPLPLIGLSTILVIASEIYCLRKKGRFENCYATVLLLLMTGVGSMYAVFTTNSTVFSTNKEHTRGIEGFLFPRDRLPIESWYFPSVLGLLLILSVVFAVGTALDLKEKKFGIATFRIPVFILVLNLSVSTASIPYQMNSWLEQLEVEYNSDTDKDNSVAPLLQVR